VDLKEGLNHPLAVVAVLSVILGFLGMFLREGFWFLKSVRKDTPTDRTQVAMDSLTSTMKEMSSNLHMLNHEMKLHSQASEIRHEQLLHEIRRVDSKT
jgi:hypothetical protein